MYEVHIESNEFKGKRTVQQHQLVNQVTYGDAFWRDQLVCTIVWKGIGYIAVKIVHLLWLILFCTDRMCGGEIKQQQVVKYVMSYIKPFR